MGQSEVAQITRQIELEYEACKRTFTEFNSTARHDFITARQENIAGYFDDLTHFMTAEEAMNVVLNAENGSS